MLTCPFCGGEMVLNKDHRLRSRAICPCRRSGVLRTVFEGMPGDDGRVAFETWVRVVSKNGKARTLWKRTIAYASGTVRSRVFFDGSVKLVSKADASEAIRESVVRAVLED